MRGSAVEAWDRDGKMEKLLVNKAALAMIREQKPLDAILASFAPGLLEFEAVRKGVLLYP